MLHSLASIGYVALMLLLLQALSLVVIVLLQYGVFNHLTVEETPKTGSLATAISWYTGPLSAAKPEEPNTILITLLWLSLGALMAVAFVYTSKNLSRLLHKLLRHYDRETARHLFIVKLTAAAGSFALILVAAMLLPAVQQILTLNTLLASVCIAGFWLQHYLAIRRPGLPVSQVL